MSQFPRQAPTPSLLDVEDTANDLLAKGLGCKQVGSANPNENGCDKEHSSVVDQNCG